MIRSEFQSDLDEDVCLLLQVTNQKWNYLCDCGAAARRLTPKVCMDVAGIFVSHAHIDHFCNFDTVLRHQIGIERTVTVCGPPHFARNVQS